MTGSNIDPLQMEMIADRIHAGRCVPFLGAAANIRSAAYLEGLPLGGQVAARLAERLGYEGGDAPNLARVALDYEIRTDRTYLVNYLKTLLPDQRSTPSPLLKALASLPFKLIVTTNYDRLLERALTNARKDFRTLVQHAAGFPVTPETKAELEGLETYDGLILYKIHGTFTGKAPPDPAESEPEGPSPIIITEDDYIQYLGVVGKENIGVPRLIRRKIIPSTLLFLGYSLEDWDFRTIWKGLIETLPVHQQRKSFAVQNNPPQEWVTFWQGKQIVIYDVDVYEFATELIAAYKEKYSLPLAEGEEGK